jgi:S1-C subfamily serine protease
MFRQRPGEVLHLGVLKGSVVSKIDVTVEESKRDAASLIDPSKAEQYVVPRLGILALPISADVAEAIGDQRQSGGLVVVAKTFGVASDLVDLRVGDILYSANQIKLDSLDTLKDFMKSLKPGDPAVIQVERDGLLSFVAFRYDD